MNKGTIKLWFYFFSISVILSGCSTSDKKQSSLKEKGNCNHLLTSLKPTSIKGQTFTISSDKKCVMVHDSLFKNISQFDGHQQDSLHSKLKVGTNRQEIYRTISVKGYFESIIRPAILKDSIEIIKLDKFNYTTLGVAKSSDTVYYEIDFISEIDGVILYTPDKIPQFWTYSNDNKCTGIEVITEYLK